MSYESSVLPKDHRIKSIRGWYEVTARCGEYSDFAIESTEEKAKVRALSRLEYRMNGFR